MRTQKALHTEAVSKCAWIDTINRIVSFRKIGDASCYVADEPDFWPHIMMLVSAGYRLQ